MATTRLQMAADNLMKSALEVKSTFTTLAGKATNIAQQHLPHNPVKPKYKCPYCEIDFHYVFQCPEFAKLSPKERVQRTLDLRLCLRCLKPKHVLKECRLSRTCDSCQSQTHNSLLHHSDCQRQIHEILTALRNENDRH